MSHDVITKMVSMNLQLFDIFLMCKCQCIMVVQWLVHRFRSELLVFRRRRNCQTLFSAFPFVSDVFVLTCPIIKSALQCNHYQK